MTKHPLPLSNTHMLGLRIVKGEQGQYRWFRDGSLPVLRDKANMFSLEEVSWATSSGGLAEVSMLLQ